LHLAASAPCGGVVLSSTFTTVAEAWRRWARIPLPKRFFNNLSAVRSLSVPVLVIHGRGDEVIPFEHGKRLYEAASQPKRCLWMAGVGHNDDFAALLGERYWEKIADIVGLVDQRSPRPGV